jgi:hypothetical protein
MPNKISHRADVLWLKFYIAFVRKHLANADIKALA